MRQLTLLFIALLLAWSEPAPAQGAPLCYRARPRPACSAFVFTNFGAYLVLSQDGTNDTPFREVADWGFMANVTPRDAVGASVFASLDPLGFGLGPAVRYRRWLPPSGSFEVAVGTPLTRTNDIRGAVFGLVRWSPNHWFAVAARPELVHRPVFFCGGPTNTCTSEVQWRRRVPLGVEFGWVPGLALTAASGFTIVGLFLGLFAGRIH